MDFQTAFQRDFDLELHSVLHLGRRRDYWKVLDLANCLDSRSEPSLDCSMASSRGWKKVYHSDRRKDYYLDSQ